MQSSFFQNFANFSSPVEIKREHAHTTHKKVAIFYRIFNYCISNKLGIIRINRLRRSQRIYHQVISVNPKYKEYYGVVSTRITEEHRLTQQFILYECSLHSKLQLFEPGVSIIQLDFQLVRLKFYLKVCYHTIVVGILSTIVRIPSGEYLDSLPTG